MTKLTKNKTAYLSHISILTLAISMACMNLHATEKNPLTLEIVESEQRNPRILNCLTPLGFHLYHKEYICPVGKESFKNLSLGTHSTYGRHLDWKPVSYMNFPAPMPVCPSNGFVITKKEYEDTELEKIRRIIETEDYKTLYSQRHASYYLLAEINKGLEIHKDNHWWLLLKSTWEANTCGDQLKYNHYALETIEAARVLLKSQKSSDAIYWALNVIIPNLYRRMGDFTSAQAWLDEFGEQLPEKDSRKYYTLAFGLLKSAVGREDSSIIKISSPRNKPKE